MTGADILVVGAVLMDDLVFADGTERQGVPGGAGLYALAGAALFVPDVLLVTGTGADLGETFGPWMARNALPMHGLRIADPQAPRNLLRYAPDGSRSETPLLGAEHFARTEPRADDIRPFASTARGIYVFRNTDGFWEDLATLPLRRDVTVLWEIALDACEVSNLPRVREIAARVDAVSLNLEEAQRLVGPGEIEDVAARLAHWPVATIFLRTGPRGSLVLHHGRVTAVPPLPVAAMDATGGGNAYGGAALAGMVQGRAPLECAVMGTVAATRAIAQYGPPDINDAARTVALADLGRILNSLGSSVT